MGKNNDRVGHRRTSTADLSRMMVIFNSLFEDTIYESL